MLIKKNLYNKIIQSIPILCVDIIVKNHSRFLLLKRNNEPLKNSFYLPGGRVFKGENLHSSAARKLLEETGINVKKNDLEIVGIYQDNFRKNAFENNVKYSTISIVFIYEMFSYKNIVYDTQSSDFKWSKKLPYRFLSKTLFFKNY